MIGYTASAVLFWVGVAGFTLGGCWLLDRISGALAARRERRRPYIVRPTVPAQRKAAR